MLFYVSCFVEVTQRLSNAKESSSKPELHNHEDFAKKLKVNNNGIV